MKGGCMGTMPYLLKPAGVSASVGQLVSCQPWPLPLVLYTVAYFPELFMD